MALQPVTGVTPLHTGNVNFGARNRNNDNISEGSPMRIPAGMKAIPVAVLIAMSPLNEVNVQAANTAFIEADPIECVDDAAEGNAKVIKSAKIKSTSGKLLYTLNQVSTDGDDTDFEILELLRYSEYGSVMQRASLNAAYIGPNVKKTQQVTMVSGKKLDPTLPDKYKVYNTDYRRMFAESGGTSSTPGSEEEVKKQLDVILKTWGNDVEHNNSAFKICRNITEFLLVSRQR